MMLESTFCGCLAACPTTPAETLSGKCVQPEVWPARRVALHLGPFAVMACACVCEGAFLPSRGSTKLPRSSRLQACSTSRAPAPSASRQLLNPWTRMDPPRFGDAVDSQISIVTTMKASQMSAPLSVIHCFLFSHEHCLVLALVLSDIFFFEVCVFSMVRMPHGHVLPNGCPRVCVLISRGSWRQICNNNDRLFELEVGEDFRCDLSEAKYRRLQRLLQSGPVPEVSMQNDDDSW
eukprot:6720642-Prymnesium_polylepis.1